MLVLTRKLDETIRIGDQISITVLQVRGRTVKIGITAPREVRVLRGELGDKTDAAPVVQFEATLDISQLGTADGVVGASFDEVDAAEDVESPKSARGLSGFCQARRSQPAEVRSAVTGVLAAATAN